MKPAGCACEGDKTCPRCWAKFEQWVAGRICPQKEQGVSLSKQLEAIGFQRGMRYRKQTIKGYMPLVLEKIAAKTYSLAHYYEQNGDLMRDPEMTFEIDDAGEVSVLTYQQDNLGLYQSVDDPDIAEGNPGIRRELTRFFGQWLENLKEQGFDLSKAEELV